MIDPLIEDLVAIFILKYKSSASNSHSNNLDYSYESLGLVDTFIRTLETVKSPAEIKILLQGAAAYIGITTYGLLQKLNRKQIIKISLRTIPDFDINLELGTKENNTIITDYKINIYSALTSIHEKKYGSFNFFEKFEAQINFSPRKYLNFCTGLISTLSPYAQGAWAKRLVKDSTIELDQITSLIALEISRNKELRFPSTNLLSNPKFYKHNLILPPLGFDEPFQASRAISSLISNFLKDVDSNEFNRITFALLSSPDEIQSSIGFVLASTTNDKNLLNLAQIFSSTFWPKSKDLRHASILAKRLRNIEGHWLKAMENPANLLAIELLERDQAMGFYPYLIAPIETEMVQQENIMFLELLTLSKFQEAFDLRILIEKRSNISAWLQYQIIFLDTFLGDSSNLDKQYANLNNLIEKTNYLTSYSLKTRISLLKNDLPKAYQDFKIFLENISPTRTLAQDKNLLSQFLNSLYLSPLNKSVKEHYAEEIKNIILLNDHILCPQSFYLINHLIEANEHKLELGKLSSITQTSLNNSPWSPFSHMI